MILIRESISYYHYYSCIIISSYINSILAVIYLTKVQNLINIYKF